MLAKSYAELCSRVESESGYGRVCGCYDRTLSSTGGMDWIVFWRRVAGSHIYGQPAVGTHSKYVPSDSGCVKVYLESVCCAE